MKSGVKCHIESDYVFTEYWYDGDQAVNLEGDISDSAWQDVIDIRSQVNRVIEQARKNSIIGASLQADVTVYVDERLYHSMQQLESESRFVFLTSSVKILPYADAGADAEETDLKGLKVKVEKTSAHKCERCWHHHRMWER